MESTKKHLLLAGCFLFVGIFFTVGWQCFWADSEIWHLKIASLNGADREAYDYWIKPLYLVFLRAVYALSDIVQIPHPDMGRLIFIINGLLILFIGGSITINIKKSGTRSMLYMLFVGSSWIFLERGFRIRSDLLSLTLFLLFILFLCDGLNSKKIGKDLLVKLVLLSLMATLVTPKVSLLFLCFLPFMFEVYSTLPKNVKNTILNVVLIMIAGLVAFSIFSESFFISLLRQKTYLEGSLFDSGGRLGVFRLYRFEHVIAFVKENPLIWMAVIVKGYWILKNRDLWWKDSLQRSFDISCLLVIPLLLFFPNRTPFFICSLVPILMLVVFSGPTKWFEDMEKMFQRLQWITYGLVLGILFSVVYKVQAIVVDHNNSQQRMLYEVLKSFAVSYPDMVIYDPVGLSPAKNAVHYYLGPGDLISNKTTASLIEALKPDIILTGQRFAWAQRVMDKDFFRHYHDFTKNGLLQKGTSLEAFQSQEPSEIKELLKVDMQELMQKLLVQNHYSVPLSIYPLTSKGNLIPDMFLEFDSKNLVPVPMAGMPLNLAYQAKYFHYPKAASELVIYERIPFLLGQFSMPQLLRFDPEL